MPRRPRLAVIVAAFVALGLQGSATPQQPPGYLGAIRWTMADPRFGGFSAIEVSSDGSSFTALNDKGAFVEGHLRRAPDGTIAAIDVGPMRLLKSKEQKPLAKGRNDSEGMAIAADGTVYVSFEGVARVLRYGRITGVAENLPTPVAFKSLPHNAALESLAIDSAGALYTIPEELPESKRIRFLTGQRGNANGADFPVWRFADGTWTQPFNLPRDGVFLPVAADFGPDGRLYVLERAFHGIAGFSSRVRSFKVGQKALSDSRTHLQTPAGFHDNLEGLSAWRDGTGAIRLTMVSDDNFMPFQHTEIVEYRLAD
ncbi:MAG: esterase-like activity of phytase family protein [Paracoccaceae bacterium]